MTTTDTTAQVPVRLDFDSHAAAFSAAMARLDKAATKELAKAFKVSCSKLLDF